MLSNYHTHSNYCDGKCAPQEYVDYAVGHGFTHLGFSGHAPVPFESSFAIKECNYLDYCNEIRTLKERYADRIEIRLGLEVDYITAVQEDFAPLVERGQLEYTIGSIHLITNPEEFDAKGDIANQLWFIDGPLQERYDEGLQRIFHGDIRKGVTTYFRQYNAMLLKNRPTIAGHVDKIVMHNRGRYFDYNERWFRDLLYETIELIAQLGIVCEINTRGIYKGRHDDYYPARQTIRHMNTLGIPVTVATDAHHPTDLDKFEGAYEFLRESGYKNVLEKLDF